MTRLSRLLSCAFLVVTVALAGCDGATPRGKTEDVVAQIPFAPGERLIYAIRDAAGTRLGTGTLTVVERDGHLALRQTYEETAPPSGLPPSTDGGSVDVDAKTLRPLAGTRQIARREGDIAPVDGYTWTYGEVSGKDVLRSTAIRYGKSPSLKEITLRDHYYDNETSLWLWRTLDFAEGYNRFYVSANAVEQEQQTVNLSIPQRETINVPAGTFEAWRLIFRSGRAVRTAWVNVDAPHEVVRWDNGDVIFELESSGKR
ncbi:MAG: hypothetical protein C4558_01940 [Dehalococcoidia bacterium]|nr:MAG: hypothetical protein C4558_01940 [Dehalococcoidia bacterium]